MQQEINATKRTDIYQIDPRNVDVVAGFNVRRKFDIEELKEQIKLNGVLNPITVIPTKLADGTERYRLVDGERRLRATLAAIEEVAKQTDYVLGQVEEYNKSLQDGNK